MDFSITPQQEQMCEAIVAFARGELNHGVVERDREGTFPFDLWRKCAERDLCALPFPEEYGGCGQDLLTTALCVEALAYGCEDSGLVHAILTQLVAGIGLDLFGGPELKRAHLPAICRGTRIAAQAATEADAGSDVFSMHTRAALQEDGTYRLDGTKMYVSNGPVADLVLVLATTDPEHRGLGAHSLLLVEKETPGFSARAPLSKMGLRTLQNSELVFDGCRVPGGNLVGKDGQGGLLFHEIMERERILFGASHVGTLLRVIDRCTAHARQRKQFGGPIAKHQAVSSKIVRMKMNAELGRLMVQKAASLKDQGRRATMEAATIKIFASESLRQACLDAVQIHGAMGYMTETQVERDLRDSVAGTIYSGTVELNSMIIGRLLGL